MEFEERLQRAIQRGKQRQQATAAEARARALTEEELKSLHSQYRLQLSDHIEQCLKRMTQHFPGFQVEIMYGDRGWGAAASRDDLQIGGRGERTNSFSRLEMTVRPYSPYHVVDLQAKGTIRNKEVFSRRHYEELDAVDLETFSGLIDAWILEYAELYAAV